MLILNETNFVKDINKSKFIAVDFFAGWCKPCQVLAPSFKGLEKHYKGKIKLAKVDIDACPSLAKKFGVIHIPCIIVFKNGREEQRIKGLMPEQELKARFDEVLGRK